MAATPVQSNMRATDATGSGGSFGSVFRQVQGEVARFIEQGGGSATTLNPQGRAYLEQSQPVNVLGSINQGGEIGEVQQQFLASIKPWTEETGARLGVAPEIVAAHAALESGWGQRPLRQVRERGPYALRGITRRHGARHPHDELRPRTRSRVRARQYLFVGRLAHARVHIPRAKRSRRPLDAHRLRGGHVERRTLGKRQLRHQDAFVHTRQNLLGELPHEQPRSQRGPTRDGEDMARMPQ
jgi:hypothetical protein